RKVRRVGLRGEHRAQVRVVALPRVDEELVALLVDGREERQALDVVPVRVAHEQVRGAAALAERALHHLLAELADAGAGVDDDVLPVGGAHLDARGVAAVTVGVGPWNRIGPTDSPEAYLHGAALWAPIRSTVTRVHAKIQSAAGAIAGALRAERGGDDVVGAELLHIEQERAGLIRRLGGRAHVELHADDRRGRDQEVVAGKRSGEAAGVGGRA